ncbi:hypothetical protein PIROE2DRAFT_15085 [Piromyces sp. E2]|nr:hypothetical protein PIROE2DRAFT_15085 [Piromyces sp. E2]|eukprot:OUM59393.1 hypothetical protein PIROE2DRAFT_15085 [Piromyces sp. E2]
MLLIDENCMFHQNIASSEYKDLYFFAVLKNLEVPAKDKLHIGNNYKSDYGLNYGGPMMLGYMQWLNERLRVDDIHKVLFVTRDGYTSEKVFNIIQMSEASTYYFYLPQKVLKTMSSKNPHQKGNS